MPTLNKSRSMHKIHHNKTLRRVSNIMSNSVKSKIVVVFMEMLNMVKLYHWKTRSFSQHKATDELYAKLNENVDTFMEILLGKDESRVYLQNQRIHLFDYNDVGAFKKHIQGYRTYLISMNTILDHKKDSDLLNVRDEILGNINQFIYLLTFDK